LAAHKGSFGHHLRKLDDDEKRLAIRDAIEPATADPTLNAGRGRQDDPLSAEAGSQTWVVSEGGLYTVILRCREATTGCSFAHRFRRWVTKEVLPEVRRTGSYSVNGPIGQDGSIVLRPLDGVARYVVVGVPGEAPHIRRTGLMEMVAENTSLDVQGLCYALKAIEVWWNKVQILNRSTSDQDQGFSARQLEKAILEGGALADRYLGLLKYLSAAE
jgi:hypothetical protein